MAKKPYRRNIRINGKMKKSPKGLSKIQADMWYSKKLEEKATIKAGVYFEAGKGPTLNEYVHGTWIERRKKIKQAATWTADQQRYRDYVEQDIGYRRISTIDSIQVRNCLKKVVEEHGRLPATRTRVQALLSKIFKDAFNEDNPLVRVNPVSGIQFDDKRTGKKAPRHLKKRSEILHYLSGAKELSLTHLTFAVIALGAGLRKQEIIPLRWSDWDEENHALEINRRFIQATGEILKGTKSGSDEGRTISISDEVEAVLYAHRASTPFNKDSDHILAKKAGKFFSSRDIARLNDEICKQSGVSINPHGLRHTFGRTFAKDSGGNLKALQTVLGHSTMAVTEIYSTLSGEEVRNLRNVVKIGGRDE